ncbi:DUF4412 domain-containing protein [Bacteroidales bacterium OttesenSCG-928-I21]|nr:DUF4412 domain-containing protein [Bacteroidales bacterium OttesenSCG-928-I21]
MKNYKFLFLFLVAISISIVSFAQKGEASFTGTIKYDVTILSEMDAMTKAQMPTELTFTYGENKVRMDQVSPMAGSTALIYDYTNKKLMILLDLMGQLYAITNDLPDDTESEENVEKPAIKFVDEAKTIAGYKCKKAEISSKDGDVVEVFYTEEIPTSKGLANNFDGINGTLMEFTFSESGIEMNYKVKEVKKGKVKAHLFKVPSDYTTITAEEFGKMFGQ